jgi:hypothetical protein
MRSLFSASATGGGDCRIEAWQPVPFHFYNVSIALQFFLDAFLRLLLSGQTILKHSACSATGFRNDS